MEEDTGWDHVEIRFTEGNQTFIIEQAERQAGGGLGHRYDSRHALLDRENIGIRLSEQVLENII